GRTSRGRAQAPPCRRGPCPPRAPPLRAGRGAPARSLPLLEVEVEQRDPDAASEEKHEDAEQHPAETDVPARELGIHQITASTASAAKSRARYRSEEWKRSIARRGVVSRRRRSASQTKTARSARAQTTYSGPAPPQPHGRRVAATSTTE